MARPTTSSEVDRAVRARPALLGVWFAARWAKLNAGDVARVARAKRIPGELRDALADLTVSVLGEEAAQDPNVRREVLAGFEIAVRDQRAARR